MIPQEVQGKMEKYSIFLASQPFKSNSHLEQLKKMGKEYGLKQNNVNARVIAEMNKKEKEVVDKVVKDFYNGLYYGF